jgi:hypothetical protein
MTGQLLFANDDDEESDSLARMVASLGLPSREFLGAEQQKLRVL